MIEWWIQCGFYSWPIWAVVLWFTYYPDAVNRFGKAMTDAHKFVIFFGMAVLFGPVSVVVALFAGLVALLPVLL